MLDKACLIRQNKLTVFLAVMNFKKRRHDKLAVSTLCNMLMDALRISFIFNRKSVFPATISHFTFRLSDVIVTTSFACQGIYDVTCVACEVITDFKRLTLPLERDMSTFLQIIAAFARSSTRYFSSFLQGRTPPLFGLV